MIKFLDSLAPFVNSQALMFIGITLTLMISLFLFKMKSNKEFLYFTLAFNAILIVVIGLIPPERGIRVLVSLPVMDMLFFLIGVYEFVSSIKAIIKYAPTQKDVIKNMSLGNYLNKGQIPKLATSYCQKYKNHRLSKKAYSDGCLDIKKLSMEELFSLAIEEYKKTEKSV
jgi:hypothetical protein